MRHAFAFDEVCDVLHVTKRKDILTIAASRGDALFEKFTASHVVALHTFPKQVAAAEDAFAMVAAEARAVLKQLHGARLVLRDAFALVAASCASTRQA